MVMKIVTLVAPSKRNPVRAFADRHSYYRGKLGVVLRKRFSAVSVSFLSNFPQQFEHIFNIGVTSKMKKQFSPKRTTIYEG